MYTWPPAACVAWMSAGAPASNTTNVLGYVIMSAASLGPCAASLAAKSAASTLPLSSDETTTTL
jgi:hypothetical protein